MSENEKLLVDFESGNREHVDTRLRSAENHLQM